MKRIFMAFLFCLFLLCLVLIICPLCLVGGASRGIREAYQQWRYTVIEIWETATRHSW